MLAVLSQILTKIYLEVGLKITDTHTAEISKAPCLGMNSFLCDV